MALPPQVSISRMNRPRQFRESGNAGAAVKPAGLILILGLAVLNLTTSLLATGFESRIFTPYFDMSMAQGGYLADKGGFFTGADIELKAGLLSKIREKHELFTLYGLDFSGQAFRFPDTRQFESKSMNHDFNVEYRWRITDRWRVRPGLAYGKALTQTAAAEIWGEGLYDNKSTGGQFGIDYSFPLRQKKSVITFQWLYRSIKFPNYTDIIREFQGADENTELAGGLKDQTLQEFSLGFSRQPFQVRIRRDVLDFKNEKVVEGGSNSYGSEKQKDISTIMSAALNGRLWIFEAVPELSYQIYRSNQNFLLFESATDPTPVFAADYYDYNEYKVAVPLFVNFTEKWALNLGFEERFRSYRSRSPRDSDNNFTGGTQKNNMVTLTAGIRKKMNDVSYMFLRFTTVTASSNNKFERYVPSNYTGQGISLGYQLTY